MAEEGAELHGVDGDVLQDKGFAWSLVGSMKSTIAGGCPRREGRKQRRDFDVAVMSELVWFFS